MLLKLARKAEELMLVKITLNETMPTG